LDGSNLTIGEPERPLSKLNVEERAVGCAETDAEVLVLENYRHIFKYSFVYLSQTELAGRHLFKFHSSRVKVFQRLESLEFLWTALVKEVTEHKLDF